MVVMEMRTYTHPHTHTHSPTGWPRQFARSTRKYFSSPLMGKLMMIRWHTSSSDWIPNIEHPPYSVQSWCIPRNGGGKSLVGNPISSDESLAVLSMSQVAISDALHQALRTSSPITSWFVKWFPRYGWRLQWHQCKRYTSAKLTSDGQHSTVVVPV